MVRVKIMKIYSSLNESKNSKNNYTFKVIVRSFILKKQKSYKTYTLDPYYNPIKYKQNGDDQRSKKEKQKRGERL